jgi:hypothetical protein
MELLGALLAIRLARKIRDSFTFKFKGPRYFAGSSEILDMLKCNSARIFEFVGTRVSEIKTLSSQDEEWFWVQTDCNLADMGTRPSVELPYAENKVEHKMNLVRIGHKEKNIYFSPKR